MTRLSPYDDGMISQLTKKKQQTLSFQVIYNCINTCLTKLYKMAICNWFEWCSHWCRSPHTDNMHMWVCNGYVWFSGCKCCKIGGFQHEFPMKNMMCVMNCNYRKSHKMSCNMWMHERTLMSVCVCNSN